MSTFEWIQAGTSIVTMLGVLIAARQLAMTREQARAQFEDKLTEQYRRIAGTLPLNALLGQPLDAATLDGSLRAFYEYFDLSNEQAFLYKHGRIADHTWATWREGIQQHLKRESFRQAWARLNPHLHGSFDELRAIIADLELHVPHDKSIAG